MNVFNPHLPLQQLSLAERNAFLFSSSTLTRGQKSFLWPSHWHQSPCRQRQAVRAPGPQDPGWVSNKIRQKVGCQWNRTCCPVMEEVHECLWLHVHDSVICMYMVQLPMNTCTCLFVSMLTRCPAPVCREHSLAVCLQSQTDNRVRPGLLSAKLGWMAPLTKDNTPKAAG